MGQRGTTMKFDPHLVQGQVEALGHKNRAGVTAVMALGDLLSATPNVPDLIEHEFEVACDQKGEVATIRAPAMTRVQINLISRVAPDFARVFDLLVSLLGQVNVAAENCLNILEFPLKKPASTAAAPNRAQEGVRPLITGACCLQPVGCVPNTTSDECANVDHGIFIQGGTCIQCYHDRPGNADLEQVNQARTEKTNR
jgi:hypothetical protein